MMKEYELVQKAFDEMAKVFGVEYLQKNYANTCCASGIINGNTYQLFLGIKGSRDLPKRKANDKGWVVYGLTLLDAFTGEVKKMEYVLE